MRKRTWWSCRVHRAPSGLRLGVGLVVDAPAVAGVLALVFGHTEGGRGVGVVAGRRNDEEVVGVGFEPLVSGVPGEGHGAVRVDLLGVETAALPEAGRASRVHFGVGRGGLGYEERYLLVFGLPAVEVDVDFVDVEDAGGVAGAEALGDGVGAQVLVVGVGVALAVIHPGGVVADYGLCGRGPLDLDLVGLPAYIAPA